MLLSDGTKAEQSNARKPSGECLLSWDLIKKQNACTSDAIIAALASSNSFRSLSEKEAEMLVARDKEDDVKLERGIEISIRRGALKKIDPPEVCRINVEGKTPQEVAQVIVDRIPSKEGKGSVVVLQGMSGTGKGTTTATLLRLLPNSVSWSNGNVFRSLTLLAATESQQKGLDLAADAETILTPESVDRWMSMLSFERVAPKQYEIHIRGLGFDTTVNKIQNTTLKEPLVARNIPTVAEQTQGDVIKFAAKALTQMAEDGMNVVLEGRAATVQYVPTPYRFELVLENPMLLGQRRAAQRVMAGVLECFKDASPPPDQEDIVNKSRTLCEQWC